MADATGHSGAADERPAVPEIPVLASRQRTYTVMLAAMVGLLGLALIVPVVFGHTPAQAPSGLASLPLQSCGGGLGCQNLDPSTPGATGSQEADPTASPSGSASVGPSTGGAPRASAAATQGRAAGGRAATTGADNSLFGGAGQPSTSTTPRTASDHGVTPTAIRVGVLLVDLGGASKLGNQAATETGYSPAEQQAYFDAYFRAVNDAGGVNGRMLVGSYQTVDVLSQSSSQTACANLTQGANPVFVATNVLGVYGPPILCYTQGSSGTAGGTPYIGNDGAVSSYYTTSKGLLFTIQPSTLRTQLNDVYEMYQAGELTKPGVKIGFLHEDDYLTADSTAVEGYIKQLTGQDPVDGTSSSSDTSMAQSALASDAVKMCTQGVNTVFVAVNALYMEEFGRGVDAQQNCSPSYFTSDFDYQMAGDAFLGGQTASYYKHALGVSSTLVGDTRDMRAVRPTEQQCLQTYESGGGETGLTPTDAHYIRAMAVCGLVASIVRGLAGGGVNPTRQSFATALQQVGAFDNPGYSASTFTPQKQDAPNQVRVLVATQSCKCWVPEGTGDFHTSRY